MIKSELIENGNRIHYYSDAGFKLLQNETGIIYDDAIDVMPCKYTYSETDELVEDMPIENIEINAPIENFKD